MGDLENIQTIYQRTSPKRVLQDLKGRSYKRIWVTDYYPEEWYTRYSVIPGERFSADEIREEYRLLMARLKEEAGGFGILRLPYLCAKTCLMLENGVPICRIERLLDWNEYSLMIGQDILTTAWLAFQGSVWEKTGKRMDWPPILDTNDRRLNNLFKERGLAENHAHLYGSTQSFSLSWAVLMNHPKYISSMLRRKDEYKGFRRNMNSSVSYGEDDNALSWSDLLCYAAGIRVLLFNWLHCLDCGHSMERFLQMPLESYGREQLPIWVGEARVMFGARVPMRSGRKVCLDYAMNYEDHCFNEKSEFRLLGGERNFLLSCFEALYFGKLGPYLREAFFLYLLIQIRFRGEMIQNNRLTGFYNFERYQDRKDKLFEWYHPYREESLRIAIDGAMKHQSVRVLETRVGPSNCWEDYLDHIQTIDDCVISKDKARQGYVVHFIKKDDRQLDEWEEGTWVEPRFHESRKKAYRQAIALAQFIRRSPKNSNRIWGIDAAAAEVRCRPEAFATEFRYLRRVSEIERENRESGFPLGVTYHVGEDFLSVVSGLRAVDEAMQFLGLRRNDRIGHGLVLGIDIEDYHVMKGQHTVMGKQDLLDDLVWVLNRCQRWNVDLSSGLRVKLRDRAMSLLGEVFYLSRMKSMKESANILEDYFLSWRLRGDHPSLYEERDYEGDIRSVGIKDHSDVDLDYALSKRNVSSFQHWQDGDRRDNDRRNPFIRELLFRYHHDGAVRRRGQMPVRFDIEGELQDVMKGLQEKMRSYIASWGIVIECNPTSNYLIGTFRTYERHPIFTFNSHFLNQGENVPQLNVTVNTDDLGVFNSSLRQEYALLLEALRKKRRNQGEMDEQAIFDYLKMLIDSGFQFSFAQIGMSRQCYDPIWKIQEGCCSNVSGLKVTSGSDFDEEERMKKKVYEEPMRIGEKYLHWWKG